MNTQSKAEFQVENIVNSDSDTLVADGRLILGSLYVGQCFNSVCEHIISSSNVIETENKPVELTIIEIVIYGKRIDKIEEGLTARIILKGMYQNNIDSVISLSIK